MLSQVGSRAHSRSTRSPTLCPDIHTPGVPGGTSRENLLVAFQPVGGWQWVSQMALWSLCGHSMVTLGSLCALCRVPEGAAGCLHGAVPQGEDPAPQGEARPDPGQAGRSPDGQRWDNSCAPALWGPQGTGHPSPALCLPSQCTEGVLLAGSPAPAPPSQAVSAPKGPLLSAAALPSREKCSWLCVGRSGETRRAVAQSALQEIGTFGYTINMIE